MPFLVEGIKQKIRYFGDMSNLHGVRHVFSRSQIPFLKRCFWASILMACCVGAGAILRSSLNLFTTNAASYSVLTDYLDWDTPFPAVTVCEQSDNGRVKAFLNQSRLPASLAPFYKEVAFWNINYCRTCKTCKLNQTCVEDFYAGIKKVRLRCPELLTDCWFGGKYFRCCDKFHRVDTEYGPCFVFNSALTNTTLYTVNRRVGLPNLIFSAVELVGIRIHSPEDIVSTKMENILGRFASLPLVTNFDAILKVEQTVNSATVKTISPSARGCLFSHETPDIGNWSFHRYTYSKCLLHCRGLAQNNYCNCTHHFLANIGKFHRLDTEYGPCFVFNSALTNTTLYTVNRRVGLPNLIFSAVELVGIRIHSPEDIVSTKMENILGRFASLPLVTNFDAILKVEQTVNSATVKTISPSARGCLFSHETPDIGNWSFHRYTYSKCLLHCRGLAQNSYCNCTHHFLANIVKLPACDVKGLACLYQNKDQILNFKCTCPMVCEDVQYKAVHVFFNRVSKTPSELMSRGTRARVRIDQLPSLRVRRFAIRDNLDLAVDIGGVGGVFFGASLLSVVEVVYLFCIRRN